MGVRLNKVLGELNIGLQTAIDYLKKKNLGDIADATVNTKISDEQYNALVKEFKGDKDVKTQAGMIFPKKEKKAKPEQKPEPTAVKEEAKQTFTPLGKIDLSTVGKPKHQEEKPKAPEAAAPKQEQKPVNVQPAPQPKPEVKPEPKPEVKPEPKQEPKPQPKPEVKAPEAVAPKQEQKPAAQQPVAQQPKLEQKAEPKQEEKSADSSIFTLKSEKKMAPNFNVVGKIDLDSLNQSTRPKKKSKEERRKEREEKQA